MPENQLYLVVLPIVHYSKLFAGETYEEVMTLLPNINNASEFPISEVDKYIRTFKSAIQPRFSTLPTRSFKFQPYSTDMMSQLGTKCVVAVTVDGE